MRPKNYGFFLAITDIKSGANRAKINLKETKKDERTNIFYQMLSL